MAHKQEGESNSSECSVREEKNQEGEGFILRLQAQLEELFSDSHLAEDGFLLKHIQKNKEGFVNLKLLTCLKKIKVLTNNWYMTLSAAFLSTLLEVSAESTKVRRLQPYPDWLLCSPTSRLLLLWNLPADWLSSRPGTPSNPGPGPTLPLHILHRLSSYGPITSHWLLPPGQDLPKELKCYAKRQKELGQCLCAVVKYSTFAAVRKAFRDLRGAEMVCADKGLSVVTLGFRSAYLIGKELPVEDQEDNKVPIEEVPETIEVQEAQAEGAGVDVQRCQQAGDSPRASWLQRRMALGITKLPKNRLTVIRQPRGPDETKGFHNRRMLYVSTKV